MNESVLWSTAGMLRAQYIPQGRVNLNERRGTNHAIGSRLRIMHHERHERHAELDHARYVKKHANEKLHRESL